MKYVALLRGINVGGKNMIKMADLRVCLEQAGLQSVTTYIQSGNILFESANTDKITLAVQIEKTIKSEFGLDVPTVVISGEELRAIAANTPSGWLQDPEFKYNYIFLKPPYDIDEVVGAIGVLKPDIEDMAVGQGILYQSLSLTSFGRTTGSKISNTLVYKIMTIRNHNTVTKLLALLDA